MKNVNIRERGYTLTEVMVATAVFAIIVLAALMLYDRSNRVFKRGVESSNMQQNTRVAFDKLTADLRMAGFDFDRDGIPTGSVGGVNVYQQPDEQWEYIGPAAVTIRANFDYETENQPCSPSLTENCDNGREGPNYESTQFPVVTTGNDEFVTYALVPDSQTSIPACDPATNCVQFYADTNRPRSAYPGGTNENLVQITGVDLCNGGCNNPPYTLYRFTLKRDESTFTGGSNVIRTPLASNIRSLNFIYYQDAQGLDVLKDLANTNDVSSGATIRGEGQWMASNPGGLVANREIRAKVNSVRMVLTGMNEQRDPGYTDAAESLTAMKNYRKYRLETLVAPRNIGKRGMREQDTFAPGAPTGVAIATGYCGGVYIKWTAPAVSNIAGAPDQYKVMFGPIAGAGFPCESTTFTNTWGYVFGSTACGPMTPNVGYKFIVVAMNSYGSASSQPYPFPPNPPGVVPLNATKMAAPTWATNPVTSGLNGKITLRWTRPITNVSGSYSGSNQTLPPGELLGYEVQRGPSTTGPWTAVTTVNSAFDTITWDDTTVANCVPYYYKIRAVERCFSDPAYNVGGDASIGASDWSAVSAQGLATSSARPAPVTDLAVDQSLSNCNGLGGCDAPMTWPKVTQDENGVPISVLRYHIWRRDYGTAWPATPTATLNLAIPPAGNVTWTDPMVHIGGGEKYEYQVTAAQCQPGTADSDPSPIRVWPCVSMGAVMSAPAAFDGDGSAANPWKFNDTATVSVAPALPAQVASMTFRVYRADGSLKQEQPISAPGPYSYSWSIDPNQIESVTATVVDVGGCSTQRAGTVEDEASNCCLEPTTVDPSNIFFNPGSDFVDVTLDNVCGGTLALTSISIAWDTSSAVAGNPAKIDSVEFPNTSGGMTTVNVGSGSSPTSVTAPVNAKAIPTGAPGTYKIRIHWFKKPIANPVTGFSATYINNASSQTCAIK